MSSFISTNTKGEERFFSLQVVLNNIDVSCDYLKKLIKDIVVSELAFKEGEKVIMGKWDVIASQPAYTCSKLTIETLEQCVKSDIVPIFYNR